MSEDRIVLRTGTVLLGAAARAYQEAIDSLRSQIEEGPAMSLHEYQRGVELNRADEPFYALIQAAMRKADSWNLAKLRAEWPAVWDELQARYHAPGGALTEETSP